MEDKYIEREPEKIQCIHCGKYFDDDDIVSIFDEPICDDCIDYLLKNNVSYLRKILQSSYSLALLNKTLINKVSKDDVDYLLHRLDKINKERK